MRAGTLADGSAVIAGISTTLDMVVGQVVTGTGIPANATINSVDTSTQVTMDSSATADGPTDLTFWRVFQVLYSINSEERDLTRILLCKELVTSS